MHDDDIEKATKHVETGFSAIKNKFHIEEVVGSIVDVVSRFHHSVGHFLESAASRLPIINLLMESIGKVASIVQFRKQKTVAEKAELGLKVSAGLITTGIVIAAFAVPHVSAPLIIAGSSINLVYSYYSIYKINRQKKNLEKQLKTTPLQNSGPRQQLEDKIDELNENIAEYKEKIVHKSVSIITSTIALVGLIIMIANPITVAPVSVILAATGAIYTCYHFRKSILSGFKRIANGIKSIFNVNTDSDTVEHIETPQPEQRDMRAPITTAASNFLQHQQNALSHHSTETFAEHHQPKPPVAPIPTPIPAIKITNADEDDDDGGGEGRGDLDASREAPVAPELRL